MGGSHGCRSRVWKAHIQSQLRDRLGLCVTVCPDPTGGSQGNPMVPRVFRPISLHWAGQRLRTVETLRGSLRHTPTTTGLRVTVR
jgi:hypothetical protein